MPTHPLETPWGCPQHITVHAPDLVAYSTARHGGFWLGPQRWAELVAAFPGFAPWAGAPWLEEDCDATYACMLWSHLFSDECAWAAVHMAATLRTPLPWLLSSDPRAGAVLRAAARHGQRVAGLWERGSLSTHQPNPGWVVDFDRVQNSTRQTRSVIMPKYPDKRYYTTAELDQFQTWTLNSA